MDPARTMRPGPGVLLGVVVLLGAFAVFGMLRDAQASKPRCRLERVDLSALDHDGVIKVTGGVIELEGLTNTDHPAKDFRLILGGKGVGRADKLEPFERSGQDLYMVLAVEISALYGPAFDKIKDALHDFLESVPRARVKLIQFGAEIEPSPTFMPAQAVSQQLDDLNPDDQGEVKLLDALSSGLVALNKVQLPPAKDKNGQPRPPPRKVMVVLSDGLNALMDRKSFKRVGDLLRQSNVPLFAVGFSPRDDRGPLLNLGELAKRSSGTFRWAQKDEALKEQFQNLAEELNKSHVLSFSAKKLDTDKLGSATYALQCGAELKSTPLTLTGTPEPKRSVWWKWVLGILLTLIGLWGLAQGALFLLNRRSQKLGLAPAAVPPGAAPGSYPPPGTPGYAGTGSYPAGTLPPGAGTGHVGYPATGTLPPGVGTGHVGYPATGTLPPGRLYTGTLIGIGPLGGQRIKVEASLSLGTAVSGPASFAISGDPSIGPMHCELRRDATGFTLVDAGTAAGSYINDRRVTGAARLTDGDLIRLGEGTQLKFRIDD